MIYYITMTAREVIRLVITIMLYASAIISAVVMSIVNAIDRKKNK